MAKPISKCFCGKSFQTTKQLEAHTDSEHSLASYGIPDASLTSLSSLSSFSSLDPKLSVTVKDEPSVVRDGGPPSLSIIHPITISGGMLLTPGTARTLKTVNKGDILVAHKISASSIVGQGKQSVASLVSTSGTSLVTPPTTPHKRISNLSLSTATKALSANHSAALSASLGHVSTTSSQQQRVINEKVAQALAAAKQAMEADAAKVTTSAITTVNPPPAMVAKRQASV